MGMSDQYPVRTFRTEGSHPGKRTMYRQYPPLKRLIGRQFTRRCGQHRHFMLLIKPPDNLEEIALDTAHRRRKIQR
jgi:hypothetical protein